MMTPLMEILTWIARLSVVIFVASSMLAMGMSQRLSDILVPLKDWRSTLRALGVNFVIAPLLAWTLGRIVPLAPAHATGLLLLGGAAGAPFLPKLAETAGGGVSYSVALMVLLMVATILFVPVIMPLVIPGLQADALSIAGPLVVLMLIPLSVGFALAQFEAERIERLLALVRKISNLFFVLFMLSLSVLQFRAMLQMLGSFAIGTYVLFVPGDAGGGLPPGSERPGYSPGLRPRRCPTQRFSRSGCRRGQFQRSGDHDHGPSFRSRRTGASYGCGEGCGTREG